MDANTFELHVIPPPEAEFGHDQALGWLRSEAPGYFYILDHGLNAPEEEIRHAMMWVRIDLAEMVRACATAIEGHSVEVGEVSAAVLRDYGLLKDWSLILAAREFTEGDNTEISNAYAALTRQFTKRLHEREAA